eukprot:99702_1
MPGMMDTVLNLGLNDQSVEGLTKVTGNPRFAADSYRRFIQMFGNVVKGVDGEHFEANMDKIKEKYKAKSDAELSTEALQEVTVLHKKTYEAHVGSPLPQDPNAQLWEGISAVFGSWMNSRAIKYREINEISGLFGTAVNVQSMVFGNMGSDSATGVAFSRNPSTGDPRFYGEFLIDAQGEDVVAGIRTPQQITKEGSLEWASEHGVAEAERAKSFPSLEEAIPECYKELIDAKNVLEQHFKEMQDIEFTIQQKKFYMLQCRTGKRTTASAVRIAVDMANEGLITKSEALLRVPPAGLDQLLHKTIDTKGAGKGIGKGLPASPGAAVGQVVFTAEDAEKWATELNRAVVLCRIETSPEDISGMHVSKGILTSRGGMTSHAAVVARGMGVPCVAGCGQAVIHY